MTDCGNVITVVDSDRPIESILGEYLTTSDEDDGILDFERISPIPVYLQPPPNKELYGKTQYNYNFDYARQEAYDKWIEVFWGCDGLLTDGSVGSSMISFYTNGSPASGIVRRLAILSGHVLRLTYLSDYNIGELVAYPDGSTRGFYFDDVGRAPRWLKVEMGVEEEDFG